MLVGPGIQPGRPPGKAAVGYYIVLAHRHESHGFVIRLPLELIHKYNPAGWLKLSLHRYYVIGKHKEYGAWIDTLNMGHRFHIVRKRQNTQ